MFGPLVCSFRCRDSLPTRVVEHVRKRTVDVLYLFICECGVAAVQFARGDNNAPGIDDIVGRIKDAELMKLMTVPLLGQLVIGGSGYNPASKRGRVRSLMIPPRAQGEKTSQAASTISSGRSACAPKSLTA